MGKTRPGSWVFGGGLFGLFDFHEGGRLLGLLLLGNDDVGENKVVVGSNSKSVFIVDEAEVVDGSVVVAVVVVVSLLNVVVVLVEVVVLSVDVVVIV